MATPVHDPAPDTALSRHERRVEALRVLLAEPGAPAPLRIDTHISTVVVTARFAWKLKRPVSLGFVDLTDPDRRRALCVAEVRLNRRLAPSLYLGVVPVEDTVDGVRLGEPCTVDDADEAAAVAAGGVELAVWMRAFDQSALWANGVPAGRVTIEAARALGTTIGAFHRDRATPRPSSPHGTSAAFRARVRDNFTTLRAIGADIEPAVLDLLEADAARRGERLAALRDARNRDGFVRDCHGDLHLGNVVTLDGEAVPFDCLEFDDGLRTIDVADEVAFTMMDLHHAGRPDLAVAFLDGWLAVTGDFDAVALLDDCRAYRAMVRAKVAALTARAAPRDAAAAPAAADPCGGYLHTARSVVVREASVLVLMHGLSGSGKSVLSAVLAPAIGAIRLRSDVERKRAHGVAPTDRGGAHGAMYAPDARGAVYARLADLAAALLALGWPVVVDASFLARAERARFEALAARAGVRCVLVDLDVPEPVLRARVAARSAGGTDASDADLSVLDAQLRGYEPLDAAERARALVFRADDALEPEAVAARWRDFGRTGRPGAEASRRGPSR